MSKTLSISALFFSASSLFVANPTNIYLSGAAMCLAIVSIYALYNPK